MPDLYLVRHGIAEEESPSSNDADRRLTERGRRRTAQVARGLSRLGITAEVILTSPFARAVETARILARVVASRADDDETPPPPALGANQPEAERPSKSASPASTRRTRVIEELPELALGGGASGIVRALQRFANRESIIVVGHEPDLGELASYLLTGTPGLASIEFKKASVAALRVKGFQPRSNATLRWLMTPKQLTRM